MSLTATERVDVLNIGLMLLSACIAIIIPFETFLFVYAVLGPLHYLTEISWLHDKKYFTKGKYDSVILLAAAALLTLYNIGSQYLEPETREKLINFDGKVLFVVLLGSLVFIMVKNTFYKWAGIVLLILMSQLANNFALFFTVFLPTLIHVYLFTMLFMLYGAFKSKSRVGLFSVLILLLIPVLLYTVMPDTVFFHVTEYGKRTYTTFKALNMITLNKFFDAPQQSMDAWDQTVFYSRPGILFMRFVAFAYTYHYLNWFSKTKVIQWHKVPKWRFALVIAVWGASLVLYKMDYLLGFQWLYFLSFLHVIMEFPLNMVSITGIAKHLKEKVVKPKPVPVKS